MKRTGRYNEDIEAAEAEIERLRAALIATLSRLDDRTTGGRTPEEELVVQQANKVLRVNSS